MTLDDSVRGVIQYAFRIGWRTNSADELKGVYRNGEKLYEINHPIPRPEPNEIGFQGRIADWLRHREIYAAQCTREYVKIEINERKRR